tara:strand:+ start:1598 stop:1915 length:318 start_codon:yes stop_codon:yes gene_type:complete
MFINIIIKTVKYSIIKKNFTWEVNAHTAIRSVWWFSREFSSCGLYVPWRTVVRAAAAVERFASDDDDGEDRRGSAALIFIVPAATSSPVSPSHSLIVRSKLPLAM